MLSRRSRIGSRRRRRGRHRRKWKPPVRSSRRGRRRCCCSGLAAACPASRCSRGRSADRRAAWPASSTGRGPQASAAGPAAEPHKSPFASRPSRCRRRRYRPPTARTAARPRAGRSRPVWLPQRAAAASCRAFFCAVRLATRSAALFSAPFVFSRRVCTSMGVLNPWHKQIHYWII